MKSLNEVLLLGNLGDDPELAYTRGGTAFCTFSLALNEEWTNQDTGAKESKVTWVQVKTWGRVAEVCREYLRKGNRALVRGKIVVEEYQVEGTTKRAWKVQAHDVHFFDKNK